LAGKTYILNLLFKDAVIDTGCAAGLC